RSVMTIDVRTHVGRLDLQCHRRRIAAMLLDGIDAVLAQDLLYALDGVAFAMQEMANAAQQLEILGPIVATTAAALHRFDLVELDLPEAQHVLWDLELVSDFTDGPERLICLRHDMTLALKVVHSPSCHTRLHTWEANTDKRKDTKD